MLLQRVAERRRRDERARGARDRHARRRGGARPRRRLGSIEVGKRADLALWDVSGLEAAGAWDPVAALVLCGPFAVRDLVVEGRPVVLNGRLAGVDLGVVIERARSRVARLLG